METRPFGWGWLLLGAGAAILAATYLGESYTWFCWGWVLCAASIAWLALCKLRNGITQALLVGAALLNIAAGVCNGAVMAANGGRMPVEYSGVGADAPSFLDAEADQDGFVCRLLITTDDSLAPETDAKMHVDVPIPRILRGNPVRSVETPALAFLDDRHAVSVCGVPTIYSKGDLMGFIGTVMLGLPGLVLLAFGWTWRRLFRKKRVPVS